MTLLLLLTIFCTGSVNSARLLGKEGFLVNQWNSEPKLKSTERDTRLLQVYSLAYILDRSLDMSSTPNFVCKHSRSLLSQNRGFLQMLKFYTALTEFWHKYSEEGEKLDWVQMYDIYTNQEKLDILVAQIPEVSDLFPSSDIPDLSFYWYICRSPTFFHQVSDLFPSGDLPDLDELTIIFEHQVHSPEQDQIETYLQIIRRLFVLEPGAERFSNLQKIFTSANLGRAAGSDELCDQVYKTQSGPRTRNAEFRKKNTPELNPLDFGIYNPVLTGLRSVSS
ncbi:uncharacterized protein LOC111712311 isoform X2 [Eurytemora carolleeae]|uniref:uncharacterized protein LOC111712311 isoform X2 n=1 Tax=Eurytemora carolleeae TaxID=1294199 RepID=UPI000C75DFDA|nr:uncharacterized protein LOC111712311 isoform X2 [Eurytemora carolleeae]|eukprot:XP_023342664.1 uncharacterized protein LOC111712311 isoform X2 [Eurytemora affinis]